MTNNRIVNQLIVLDQTTLDPSRDMQPVALFGADGAPVNLDGAISDAAIQTAFNALVYGPFTLAHNTPNIDTGVTLFTPAVGDRIVGVSVETTEEFDVEGEMIGLGITGTTDADLAFKFATQDVPDAVPSFPRGQGKGVPLLSQVERITSATPLKARTVIGGNTTGSVQFYVYVYSVALY